MASLQKCRCWRFTIDACLNTTPWCLLPKASYLCWDYDDVLKKCYGYVQYPTCRAAAKVPLSKWCKSTAAFVSSEECYKQNTYGISTVDIKDQKKLAKEVLPEVLDDATYKLLLKRDAYVKDCARIAHKESYLRVADKKRKLAESYSLAKTRRQISKYRVTTPAEELDMPILSEKKVVYNFDTGEINEV